MSENVGTIYYTVEADTAKLLDSIKPADSSLDSLGKTFGRTDKAANAAEFQLTKTAAAVKSLGRESSGASSALGGLGKVLGGLLTLQGVNSLIQMADGYNAMAERVRMATASQEEYEMVQQRLLATANTTYRAMSEAQEVYIQTADSIRAMGYSTSQALDITDSLSYSFVKNATAADRAQSTIRAYDLALNKGKVDAIGWLTIVGAIPTVVGDIATAMGKTEAEIRKMGASGEISARMLNEGLLRSVDANKAAAEGMATTVADAFTKLRNNLAAYVGEANQATGATGILSSAIEGVAENIDLIAKGLMAAGAGALALYIARAGQAALSSVAASAAARKAASAALVEAQARVSATQAALAQAQANAALGGSYTHLTAAQAANTAATAALTTAQRAAATASAGLLSVLGGPAGIIALVASAAAGFVLFGNKARGAVPGVNELTNAIDKLGEAQLRLRRQQAEEVIEGLEKQAREAGGVLLGMEKDYAALTERIGRGVDAKGLDNATRSITEQRAEVEKYGEDINTARAALEKINQEIERRGRQSTGGSAPEPQQDPEVAKRLQSMRDELELAKVTGEARAKLQALQRLGANATAEERAEAERLAAEIYRLESAKKSGAKATASSTKAADENIKAIDRLAESLMYAGLEGEALAVAQAKSSLNQYATPEQIATVEGLAKAMHHAAEAKANLEALKQVDPYVGEQARYDTELQMLQKANEAKLIENDRYLDLKGQAEQRHAENMVALQEQNYRAQSQWNDMLMASLDAMGAASTQAISGLLTGVTTGTQAVQMLGQAILNEVVGSFVKMGIAQVKAWVMGRAAQSAAGAAYAASVAGQVEATTALAAQAAFAATAAIPVVGPGMAPGAAAAAATAAQALGAPAIVAASASMAGGRQYGGPVGAGKMYRINETGKPEILNTASGKQYLLPNTRGEVVSNKDATRAGPASAGGVVVQLFENPDRGGQVESYRGADGEEVIALFVADIRGGGRASQAIEGTYGLTRRGM
ncbi:tape measure protein [Bordetella trematum]|uniref:tape measure protein n=1 Tax=Bordetella trematum TaxID=123899 RepID=UPI000471E4DE|nr:tape measure protein [Bordetella trematum]